jgi:GxxExxY protein
LLTFARLRGQILPDAALPAWRETKEASMTENAIATEIVDAAFRIHTTLGPGLLESVYQTVLAYELGRRGLRAMSQQPIPVVYENIRIETGCRADLANPSELVAPVHKKQLLTCLRLADKRLGLPINFQVALIRDGISASSTVSETMITQRQTRHPLLGISRAQTLAIFRNPIPVAKSPSSAYAQALVPRRPPTNPPAYPTAPAAKDFSVDGSPHSTVSPRRTTAPAAPGPSPIFGQLPQRHRRH